MKRYVLKRWDEGEELRTDAIVYWFGSETDARKTYVDALAGRRLMARGCVSPHITTVREFKRENYHMKQDTWGVEIWEEPDVNEYGEVAP